ncbi:TraR/DksA family transcriptional regulator [Methylomonas sp. MgM2]
MGVGLNEKQINKFKKKLNDRLIALRLEISEELTRSEEEQYAELAGQVHDTGDEALADLLVDIELAAVDRLIQEIRDIETALTRIAEGRYGECCDCADAIPIERLQACPTARRCLICQESHDRTFVQCGKPKL